MIPYYYRDRAGDTSQEGLCGDNLELIAACIDRHMCETCTVRSSVPSRWHFKGMLAWSRNCFYCILHCASTILEFTESNSRRTPSFKRSITNTLTVPCCAMSPALPFLTSLTPPSGRVSAAICRVAAGELCLTGVAACCFRVPAVTASYSQQR